jgi:hypothetical protein
MEAVNTDLVGLSVKDKEQPSLVFYKRPHNGAN